MHIHIGSYYYHFVSKKPLRCHVSIKLQSHIISFIQLYEGLHLPLEPVHIGLMWCNVTISLMFFQDF